MMDLLGIKGIGERRRQLLGELGIFSLEDLLSYYPQTYLDYTSIVPCHDVAQDAEVTVCVTLLGAPTIFYRHGLSVVAARATDDTGKIALRWYNQPYRLRSLEPDMRVLAHGRVSKKHGVALLNPVISRADAGIEPVYVLKKGLTQRMMRDAVAAALAVCPIDEWLPDDLLESYTLMPADAAVRALHQPVSSEQLAQAQRRMHFEKALLYLLAVSEQRQRRMHAQGFSFRTDGIKEELAGKLRFPLTGAQNRVMAEVASDMQKPEPMNRLVQGDVGSGKTMIAFYALMVAVRNGKQGAFLVPTEILARQHASTLFRELGLSCCVLLGGMSATDRKAALRSIADGSASIVIGTHALLQDDVRFRDLGLVVTDEQHRFGVSQRAVMMDKGAHVDTLVMSATPIPRTLSLLLYSDLDLSAVDEMPPGRLPVKTHLIGASRRKALYLHLEKEALAGRQSYVVCPLIDASEGLDGLSVQEISEEVGGIVSNATLGVLHGRMTDAEKQNVMERFASGQIGILITTTVIEVGVDVSTAANMVVEGAERFGLATLHQLRGRVGRGMEQSHCYLVPSQTGEAVMERLNTLLETTDGFAVAERDLALRGAGEMFGMRQHGKNDMLTFIDDTGSARVLAEASEAVAHVLAHPSVQNNRVLERAKEIYGQDRRIAMN